MGKWVESFFALFLSNLPWGFYPDHFLEKINEDNNKTTFYDSIESKYVRYVNVSLCICIYVKYSMENYKSGPRIGM